MALQRVTIGFTGSGQVLAVKVDDDALDGLLRAVAGVHRGADRRATRSGTGLLLRPPHYQEELRVPAL